MDYVYRSLPLLALITATFGCADKPEPLQSTKSPDAKSSNNDSAKTGRLLYLIHGIVSNADRTWRDPANQEGLWLESYLQEREKFKTGWEIRTFNYWTNTNSGKYSIHDAGRVLAYDITQKLKAAKNGQSAVDMPLGFEVILCAHSMGGLVVKSALQDEQLRSALAESHVNVGVIFTATPTHGSLFASIAEPFLRLAGRIDNAGVNVLKPSSEMLAQLDREFVDLVVLGTDRRGWHLSGIELMETLPLGIMQGVTDREIVPYESAGRYFGNAIKIPETDHFTITTSVVTHSYIYDFITETFPNQLAIAKCTECKENPYKADLAKRSEYGHELSRIMNEFGEYVDTGVYQPSKTQKAFVVANHGREAVEAQFYLKKCDEIDVRLDSAVKNWKLMQSEDSRNNGQSMITVVAIPVQTEVAINDLEQKENTPRYRKIAAIRDSLASGKQDTEHIQKYLLPSITKGICKGQTAEGMTCAIDICRVQLDLKPYERLVGCHVFRAKEPDADEIKDRCLVLVDLDDTAGKQLPVARTVWGTVRIATFNPFENDGDTDSRLLKFQVRAFVTTCP